MVREIVNWEKILKWVCVTVMGALISATLAYVVQNTLLKATNVHAVEFNGTKLEALNKNNESLWNRDFETEIADWVVEDIGHNKKNEIIIGFGKSGVMPGHVLVLDEGGEEICKVNTYPNTFPFDGGHSDKFEIYQLLVEDITNDGQIELVILAADPLWYVSRILVGHLTCL